MNDRVLPAVIFLDAVGTLFGVRGSVGSIYTTIAQDFGVTVSATVVNQAFRDSFRGSTPPAFPGVSPVELVQYEYDWWHTIAHQTFTKAGVIKQFYDFDAFFAAVYHYFATADAWIVYPDVEPTLYQWRRLGIRLVVLSNFDSRLFSVLQALNLQDSIDDVIISTRVGMAKPDPGIFAAALAQVDQTQPAWHIGDSYHEDYQGAIAAGLRGIWLERWDDSVPIRVTSDQDGRLPRRATAYAIAPEDHIHSLAELFVA